MLQTFRDDGWNELIVDISKFFEKFEIDVPDMDAISMPRGRSREFDQIRLLSLEDHLSSYIVDMRSNVDFQNLKGIHDLAQKMLQKHKDIGFPWVYMLIKLSLILPVATATVERGFSSIKLVKTTLRNRMGDSWLNDCLITYIERDIFQTIENEEIMKRFQSMKDRPMIL
ncbi:uncharacterized protein LOC141720086 [Apium graveolens]|uniref:uncharacterized protein LOC141720086 n=1 Tax=Apium graveolens TaxID=4045 RepID=UPI003D7BC69C